MEVAHRLYLTAGKCENIHGHSMWVSLTLAGPVDDTGKMGGLNFSEVKSEFRHFIDSTFDHHILLNEHDPWAQKLRENDEHGAFMPGLMPFPADPTTENIAKEIGLWAYAGDFSNYHVTVKVEETSVNSATWISPFE